MWDVALEAKAKATKDDVTLECEGRKEETFEWDDFDLSLDV